MFSFRLTLGTSGALAAAAALSACGRSTDPTQVAVSPQAYVRYVNASPDSPALTVRFVDKVENWRTADGVAFRGNTGWYVAVNAGQRQLRAFRLQNFTTNVDTNTVIVLDTSFTLQPQTYYTIVQTGTVLPGRGQPGNNARVTVFQDTLPSSADVGASSIRVRVYHAAPGAGNVDVRATSLNAGLTAPVLGTVSNVAAGARSPYLTLPTAAGTDFYSFTVVPTGGGTALASGTPQAFPGLPASPATVSSPALNAVAGVRLGGSALAVVVFPAAVPGSPAATTATAVPTIDLFPDNKP